VGKTEFGHPGGVDTVWAGQIVRIRFD